MAHISPTMVKVPTLRRHRLTVRTVPFQGANRGSIPRGGISYLLNNRIRPAPRARFIMRRWDNIRVDPHPAAYAQRLILLRRLLRLVFRVSLREYLFTLSFL